MDGPPWSPHHVGNRKLAWGSAEVVVLIGAIIALTPGIVLVISYMLKDRIKDLLRYYFAHKLGNKYYDKKRRG